MPKSSLTATSSRAGKRLPHSLSPPVRRWSCVRKRHRGRASVTHRSSPIRMRKPAVASTTTSRCGHCQTASASRRRHTLARCHHRLTPSTCTCLRCSPDYTWRRHATLAMRHHMMTTMAAPPTQRAATSVPCPWTPTSPPPQPMANWTTRSEASLLCVSGTRATLPAPWR